MNHCNKRKKIFLQENWNEKSKQTIVYSWITLTPLLFSWIKFYFEEKRTSKWKSTHVRGIESISLQPLLCFTEAQEIRIFYGISQRFFFCSFTCVCHGRETRFFALFSPVFQHPREIPKNTAKKTSTFTSSSCRFLHLLPSWSSATPQFSSLCLGLLFTLVCPRPQDRSLHCASALHCAVEVNYFTFFWTMAMKLV